MSTLKVLLVIDMQNGVFAEPLFDPAGRIAHVNQLIDAADEVVFIQHTDGWMSENSEAWKLIDELHQPQGAHYLSKTACDAFFDTPLMQLLQQFAAPRVTLCGCMTDFCLDATIKNAASKGLHLLIAGDAHTTVDSPFASAQQLIAHHNQVWATLTVPGVEIQVKTSGEIVKLWQEDVR
ncbi:Isochorismatase [Erwinia sp. OLTSP20]|uniref:isochorismatase family protein n=1 Tax=unclassified Erwinia TaxID=2622719 RepID=UPI000C1A5643|nr:MULTISPECIES: isochorismatase family protein [unclassified Erwinia]PIJ50719.1 Isochorismatase [Erwinia sp. OAMSP11]PIJ75389.1 Isochorismatase [Erwinia sp. OLSSP12]PIJ81887.1 Isochorismatase [Erwinia sp. OLCASP19]PIJ84542.1 Isochorismatase [Erwinia sp. OLMTSP26]PIJ86889.1 Isochorismatase [Erwinia sp. OLMDSP33]